MTATRVYLTINTVAWLARPDMADIPKCISRNRLTGYKGKRLPRSLAPVLLDSGGFTELKNHGRWRITAAEYIDEVRDIIEQLGSEAVVAIAPMDRMCEEIVINGGKSKDGDFVGTRQFIDPDGVMTLDEIVHEHQRQTVENFIELRALAPDLPIFPVIQGSTKAQYLRHVGMYVAAGVRFVDEALVGLGSVCRRQGTAEVAEIVRALSALGIKLHGFGVGAEGLSLYGHLVESTDSNAWSYNGRRAVGECPHGVVKWEANCPVQARGWWERACARLAEVAPTEAVPPARAFEQLTLPLKKSSSTTRQLKASRGIFDPMEEMQLDLFGGETAYVSKPNQPTRTAPVREDVQLTLFEVVKPRKRGDAPLIYTEPELFS